MSSLSAQPARIPIGKTSSGEDVYVAPPWVRFFNGLYVRVGGAEGPSTPELAMDLPEDSGLEELKAEFFAHRDANAPHARIEALEAQVAALLARIESLEQGNTL